MMKPLTENPYNFVPIDADQAVTDDVRGHDGRPPRAGEVLVSGTLKVEIKAITPLLAGHSQFPITALSNRSLLNFTEGWVADMTAPQDRRQAIQGAREKSVLQPFRAHWLPHSPVLIAPESLKGALLSSVQALTAAPMSRVADEHFSYRPNLSQQSGRANTRCIAVIDEVQYSADRRRIDVLRLRLAREDLLIYIQSARELNLLGRISETVPSGISLEIERRGPRRKYKVGSKYASPEPLKVPHRIHRYLNGLDGEARLLKDFHGGRPVHPHPAVLLPAEFPTLGEVHLRAGDAWLGTFNEGRAAVWAQYGESAGYGRQPPEWCVGDVIYAEVSSINPSPTLVTLGHHYYYRTSYVDTVARQWRGTNSDGTVAYQWRSELRAHPDERHADRPKLTAGRSLGGFVIDPVADPANKLGDWAQVWGYRMAGRFAFNHAVEQDCDVSAQQRFWNGGQSYAYYCPDDQRDEGWTLLPELGSPKASAVEHYLQQPTEKSAEDANGLWTYGDALVTDSAGASSVTSRSPGLAGRKVYPHQIGNIESRMDPVGEVDAGSPEHWRHYRTDLVCNPRAQWARWILNTGSRLRTTLDVRDLRLWELGALWASLRPEDWASWLKKQVSEAGLQQQLPCVVKALAKHNASAAQQAPSYGNKLGHGRPLGMGSVVYHVTIGSLTAVGNLADALSLDQPQACSSHAFKDLWRMLVSAVQSDGRPKDWAAFDRRLAAWLRAHQLSDQARHYPQDANGNIYGHHTGQRVLHAKQRRGISLKIEEQIQPLSPLWTDG